MNTYRVYAYDIRPGDDIDELGHILSITTIENSTYMSVLHDDCTYSIYDYPRDTIFELCD